MPIKTWIEESIVFREMIGEVILGNILDVLKSIPDHPDFQKGMSALWDMRDASFTKLTKNDLYKMQRFINYNAEKRGSNFKVAYVVSRDLEYGVGRMLGFILQAKPPCSRKTFRSMSEALEWINTPFTEDWEADEQ